MFEIGSDILDLLHQRIQQLRNEELSVKELHSLAIIAGILFDKVMHGSGEHRTSPSLELTKVLDAEQRKRMLEAFATKGELGVTEVLRGEDTD